MQNSHGYAIHRRYECRCYGGLRPCTSSVIQVDSRTQAAISSGINSVVGEEDARALAERFVCMKVSNMSYEGKLTD